MKSYLVNYPTIETITDFTVTVNPCQVIDFSLDAPLSDINYVTGDSEVPSDSYSFTSTPSCGYPVTVEITDLPSFVTHDESGSKFMIFEDTGLSGTFTVSGYGQISVPDDFTLASSTDMFAPFSFNIVIEQNCPSS